MALTLTHTALVLASLLVHPVPQARAQEARDSDVSGDIRARERALADAIHGRDLPRIEQLLAPDYVLRGSPNVNRETWIRNAVALCWGDRSDIDGFRALRDGDSVVATFELTLYVDPATCGQAEFRRLITDIWRRYPEGWRLAMRHSGPPPTAADAAVSVQYTALPPGPPAWVANGELSVITTGGNTSTRTVGLGAALVHRLARGTTRGSVAFVSSKVDDVTRARSLLTEARHGIRVRRRTELFGRASYERDRFAGIAHRVTSELGTAHDLSRRAHALTADAALGFTAEQRLDATELRFATATAAVRYAWAVRPGTEIREDVRVTADLQNAGNWRGTSTTEAHVSLTRLLALKASHAYEYRNTPVAGFRRADFRTAAAVVLSWEWHRAAAAGRTP